MRRIKHDTKKKKVVSPRQQLGRARFRCVVMLYRAIKGTFMREIWRVSPRPDGMTGYHNFIRMNYSAFNLKGGILDFSRLKMSYGDLRLPLGVCVKAVSYTHLCFPNPLPVKPRLPVDGNSNAYVRTRRPDARISIPIRGLAPGAFPVSPSRG